MPSHDKRVKDKRIEVKGLLFLAVVEYYQDKPTRDNDFPIERMCETMGEAQRFLKKYPRDDWVEYAMSDHNYRELDERQRRGHRHYRA
ncbi:MAG: hypothetical protein ACYS7Y_36490 [Planctomycetota bacterium]|jgi:hypothetical protein